VTAATGNFIGVGILVNRSSTDDVTIASVSWNSQSGQAAGSTKHVTTNSTFAYLWYFKSVTGGTGNLVITASLSSTIVGGIVSVFSGVANANHEAVAVANTTDPLSVPVTTVSSGALILSTASGFGAPFGATSAPDQVIIDQIDATVDCAFAYRIGGAPGSHAMGWSGITTRRAAVTAAFAAS